MFRFSRSEIRMFLSGSSAPRWALLVLVAVFVGIAASGCGDDDDERQRQPTGSDFQILDGSSDVMSDGMSDGTSDMDGMSDVTMGPMVEIVSPTDAMDLTSEQILTGSRVEVVCRVTQVAGGGRINRESILIELTNPDGGVEMKPGQPTVASNEYSAEFVLSGASNGAVAIRCTAEDSSDTPLSGSDDVATWLDLGPRIEILAPIAQGYYANNINILFRVSSEPLSDEDTAADVDETSLTVSIAGVDITDLTQDEFGNWTTDVSFNDTSLFQTELVGLSELRITAANTRQTTATRRVEGLFFTADSEGPSINVTSPSDGELVGGVFAINATVTDPAGVDTSSVVAIVGGTMQIDLRDQGGNVYTGLVDSRALNPNAARVLVEVRARDRAGNLSTVSGLQFDLDSQPPLIDLDPGLVREINADDACSVAFDPLGSDTPNDGGVVYQLAEYRGLVFDQGNSASGMGTVIRKAGVENSTVRLYVLDDSSNALLVDTNGDGFCDEINPLLNPTTTPGSPNDVAVVNLVPVTPAGSADFTTNAGVAPDPPLPPFCAPNQAGTPPNEMCDVSSPLTRVIPAEGSTPIVYAIGPVNGATCVGSAFDHVGRNIPDGWACATIRAEDTLGNVGVGAPARICIDSDVNGDNGCDVVTLSDCTGTYDAQNNTVDTSTPCTPTDGFVGIWYVDP